MSAAPTLMIVISDLDGTLLDASTYSYMAATDALAALKKKGACLVLASSKTRAELEPIRERLGHEGPFIVENGGALFVPPSFFPTSPAGAMSRDGYEVIRLGTPYSTLRAALKEIAAALNIEIQGFGDLSIEQVAKLTGLTHDEAMLAKQREYDEPIVLINDALIESVCREAAMRGLTCTRGGRFYHLLGPNDKGTACRFLLQRCRRQLAASQGRLYTVGIGDSANDFSMLTTVDQP
ncbi:MAG: HAD-IIB family hydrolase, partial [Nitrospirota bacterium]|nr:HAD-IIB family hydrolase [Nitrospirota bacterium]